MSSFASFEVLRRQCSSAAAQIGQECEAIFLERSHDEKGTDTKVPEAEEGLAPCGDALVELLHRQATNVEKLYSPNQRNGKDDVTQELVATELDGILSTSYSKFYDYKYEDLPVWWRQLYTDAAILKFANLFFCSSFANKGQHQQTCKLGSDEESLDKELTEMVKTLDLALILAGAAGGTRGGKWIDEVLLNLENCLTDQCEDTQDDDDSRPAKRSRTDAWTDSPSFSTLEPFTPTVKYPIDRCISPTLELFQAYLDSHDPSEGPQPLILSGLTDAWRARTTHPWNKPSYLLSRTFGGRRLIPVEIGRSYVDEGWGQELIPFRKLLSTYVDPSSSSSAEAPQTAYLAQHPLFTQIPSLRKDITIPDLCYTSPPKHPTDPSQDQPEVDEPKLNAWFGPHGTITPLHTDPYHNLLVQVVGRKYVRLYAPQEGKRMRPRGKENGVEMENTSLWDVGFEEGWDEREEEAEHEDEEKRERRWKEEEERMMEFDEIPFVDCILEPGDTLYIPIGWWHYVRGLSVGFSVSFWWN